MNTEQSFLFYPTTEGAMVHRILSEGSLEQMKHIMLVFQGYTNEIILRYNAAKGLMSDSLISKRYVYSMISDCQMFASEINSKNFMSTIDVTDPRYDLYRPLDINDDEVAKEAERIAKDYFFVKNQVLYAFADQIENICSMYLFNVFNEGSYIKVPALLVGMENGEDHSMEAFITQIQSVMDYYDEMLEPYRVIPKV